MRTRLPGGVAGVVEALPPRPYADSLFLTPSGLKAYERARLERTSRVVNGSADNTGRFHNEALAQADTARAYVAAEFTPERLRERYDWLHSYDATRVEI